MLGVEFALAVVALAVSSPGVAISIAECARYLQEKISSVGGLTNDIVRFKTFAEDLHNGDLQNRWRLVERISMLVDTDPGVKQSFEDDLSTLKNLLLNIDDCLDRVQRTYRRFKFSNLRLKNEMKSLQKKMDEWEGNFVNSITIYDITQRLMPDPHCLTSDTFTLTSHTSDDEDTHRLGGAHHAKLAHAELKNSDGTISEIPVLIEEWIETRFPTPGDLKHLVALLFRRRSGELPSQGILDCLGFCQGPLRLVFRIPEGLVASYSLRTLLYNDRGLAYGGGHCLDDRLRLAYQLAEAVLSVHLADLVHKNIRSDTILLFREQKPQDSTNVGSTSSIGLPFLTDWSLLRKATGLSTRGTGGSTWMEEIYRHPQRQSGSIQPAPRYHMGHDIYSLGVCLIEIGNWKALVHADKVSEDYRATALKLGVQVQPTEKLAPPLGVQQILIDLAEQTLPSRMGTRFTSLVVSCLTCLEEGLGDISIVEGNTTQVALSYKDAVLSPLQSIAFD